MFGDPKQVCLPGILILCSVFASPDSPGRDIDIDYTCEKEGATRYIEVVTEPGFACRVKYTKPALTTFPWNARNDASYCGPRAIGLVEKLGAAGWQCKSIGETSPVLALEDESSTPSAADRRSRPPVEEVSSIPSAKGENLLPSPGEESPAPAVEDANALRSVEEEIRSLPSLEDESSIPSIDNQSSLPSDEEVRSILVAQIERYGRYIESYQVVGKTCYFYPSEAEFGNLCGDEREEAVIVYTCEVDAGGWDQHLAVFHEIEPEPLVTEIGRSGFRQVSTYHIDDKLLMMETEKFALVGDSPSTRFNVEEATIFCRYSNASDWELIERQ